MKIKNFLFLLLLPLFLFAASQEQSKERSLNILLQSKALYADDIFDINSTTSRANFKNFNGKSFLLRSAQKNLWLELQVDPSLLKEPILYVSSPLLTKFNIYDNKGNLLQKLGYGKRKEFTILPYYEFKSKKKRTLYLQMQSRYIPLIASVKIGEKKSFYEKDLKVKFYNILFIGMLITVLLLLLVQLYLDRKREILYLIVLIGLLIYYQFTYSGLAHAITANTYALLDIAIVSSKINFITIALVLYTVALLKVPKEHLLYKLFKGLLLIAGIELFITGFMNLPLLYALLPLSLALLLGIFLLFHASRKRDLEYLFPLTGYILLFLHFISLIFIALGVESIVFLQEHSFLIITVALFFIAAEYLYRYIRKEQRDSNSVIEGLDRKYLLESMLQTKKDELAALNEAKEILKHDIHTIIDNNFKQILLLLESDEYKRDYSKLSKQLANMEQRMQAISICYSHMLESKNLTTIDMQQVIEEIIEQIKSLYLQKNCAIEIITEIDAVLAVNDAIIAATAISEIVMDTYKNSCHKEEGLTLLIALKQSNESFTLNVKDYPNGKKRLAEGQSPLQKIKEKLQQLRLGRSKEKN